MSERQDLQGRGRAGGRFSRTPVQHDAGDAAAGPVQRVGLHQIDPAALARLMPDLSAHADHCRFYNCTHQHEPGCGVRDAVEAGQISASRYRIYGEILQQLTSKRW